MTTIVNNNSNNNKDDVAAATTKDTTTGSTKSSSNNTILHGLQLTFGNDIIHEIIYSTRILLVGAGGIGCELIKNLVLCGYTNITIIDLDTIDVSNLNRQLLFRTHHVGLPKCHVACTVAQQLSIHNKNNNNNNTTTSTTATTPPVLNYIAHHGNVCDNTQFNTDFVKQYDIVLNALDNITARKRMNRLCLATNIPLIEAGTTGYLGQVTTIHKSSSTACYECYTQEINKVYPICTIRSTPSQPVHCIVWAKELYKLLFTNPPETIEESMLYETVSGSSSINTGNGTAATETSTEINNNDEDVRVDSSEGTGVESSTYMQAVLDFRQLLQQRRDGNVDANNKNKTSDESIKKTIVTIGTQLIQNLYVEEIQKQLNMDRYKTAQKKPVVLSESVVRAAVLDSGNTSITNPPSAKLTYRQTDILTPAECVIEFIACLYDSLHNVELILPSFDKDDVLCMRFITASANLRSIVFDIQPLQSYYSAKGIAGNIIPAIATTNAIVAGLQILQCFQILKAQMEYKRRKHNNPSITSENCCNINNDANDNGEFNTLRNYCSYVNCIRNPTRNGLYITASQLEHRNPKCFVCSKAILSLQMNVMKWTLHDFINILCKKEFGFQYPSITMDNTGNCIWEEGEGADTEAFEKNLIKLLPNLPCGGISNGSIITVEDYTQDLTVDIAITHVDQWDTTTTDVEGEEVPDDHKFIVGGDSIKPQCKSVDDEVVTKNQENKEEDDDGIIEIVGASNLKNDDGDDDTDDATKGLSGAKRFIAEDGSINMDAKNTPRKKLKTTSTASNDDTDYIEIDD